MTPAMGPNVHKKVPTGPFGAIRKWERPRPCGRNVAELKQRHGSKQQSGQYNRDLKHPDSETTTINNIGSSQIGADRDAATSASISFLALEFRTVRSSLEN